jgi:hypothetical protein
MWQKPAFAIAFPWIRESLWFLPFLALALMCLILLRPWPAQKLPEGAGGRWITDGEGTKIKIPSPLQGIAAVYLRSYLPKTHAPQYVLRAWDEREHRWFSDLIPGWIYPEFVQDERYWKVPADLESILAYDKPGMIYFRSFWIGGTRMEHATMRGFGLNSIALSPNLPPPEHPYLEDYEQRMFIEIRVLNAALNQPEVGEKLIATYLKGIERLATELKPESIPPEQWPRVLGMGASSQNWANIWIGGDGKDNPRLALKDATGNYRAAGRQQDAERVLAMNPDILFGPNPDEFYHDPRWRGLKAVQNRRVYTGNASFSSYIHDIDNLPLSARWHAEIVWPERLKASVREEIREHYRQSYDFEMSDERIDELLRVKENAVSTGYERFMAQAVAGKNMELAP